MVMILSTILWPKTHTALICLLHQKAKKYVNANYKYQRSDNSTNWLLLIGSHQIANLRIITLKTEIKMKNMRGF